MSALPNPGPSLIPPAGGGKAGGEWEGGAISVSATAACNDCGTVLLCIPELGVHVKIAPSPWLLSLAGETKACLVVQMHPVKSAASSTAQTKSCLAHARLAPQCPHDRHFN